MMMRLGANSIPEVVKIMLYADLDDASLSQNWAMSVKAEAA